MASKQQTPRPYPEYAKLIGDRYGTVQLGWRATFWRRDSSSPNFGRRHKSTFLNAIIRCPDLSSVILGSAVLGWRHWRTLLFATFRPTDFSSAILGQIARQTQPAEPNTDSLASEVEVGLCNCICVCTVIRDTDRQHRFAERKCMIQRQTAQSRHAITAPHTTSLPPQNNRLTTNLNTHPINTSVQSQPTTDHTLNVLQNRKRAPLKHFRRWLINQNKYWETGWSSRLRVIWNRRKSKYRFESWMGFTPGW